MTIKEYSTVFKNLYTIYIRKLYEEETNEDIGD